MKELRNIFLFFCLIILGACSSSSLQKYNKAEFEKNEHAVVFFDIKNEHKLSTEFELINYDTGERLVVKHNNPGAVFKSEDKDMTQRVLFIKPGLYYINYISLPLVPDIPILKGVNKTLGFPSPGISKNHELLYGGFRVYAGDVVSVGILNITPRITLEHENNYKLLQGQLPKSDKPELIHKLKKGSFYGRGTQIIKSSNGSKTTVRYTENITPDNVDGLLDSFVKTHGVHNKKDAEKLKKLFKELVEIQNNPNNNTARAKQIMKEIANISGMEVTNISNTHNKK